MNGRNTSGTVTLPSASWKFSKIATTNRGTAAAVALSVCTNCVGIFFVGPPFFLPPFVAVVLSEVDGLSLSISAGGGEGR